MSLSISMAHFNLVWCILLGRTIHIAGTDKGHTLSVYVQVSSETNHKNSAQQNDGEVL